MTTLDEALSRIRDISDPRALAAWKRLQVSSEEYWGANLTNLKKLAREIKRDHTLALELWNTGIHDARLLSTMIEEPALVTVQQIERQVSGILSTDLADKFVSNVVAHTPFLLAKSTEWVNSQLEMVRRCGYMGLVALTRSKEKCPASFYEAHLERIEKDILVERNWVREAMLFALIAIGGVDKSLNQRALAVSQTVGKIDIDYGDTACSPPDPLSALSSPKWLQIWG